VTRLSAGIITADLTRLGADIECLRGKAEWAHVDVMDGAFCPQLTVGPAFLAAVASTGIAVDAHLMVEEPRRLLPEVAAAGPAVITVHAEATRHLHRTMQEMTALSRDGLSRDGLSGDGLSGDGLSGDGLSGDDKKFLRGVAINPGTPVQAVEPVLGLADLVLVLAVNPGWSGQRPAPGTGRRVQAVRDLARQAAADVLVGVDGGVTIANAAEVAAWGPDVIVSGSAIFEPASRADRDPSANLERLLGQLNGITPNRGERSPRTPTAKEASDG
jgi:ribulose-phosphate 3-epimerase